MIPVNIVPAIYVVSHLRICLAMIADGVFAQITSLLFLTYYAPKETRSSTSISNNDKEYSAPYDVQDEKYLLSNKARSLMLNSSTLPLQSASQSIGSRWSSDTKKGSHMGWWNKQPTNPHIPKVHGGLVGPVKGNLDMKERRPEIINFADSISKGPALQNSDKAMLRETPFIPTKIAVSSLTTWRDEG
jgi:hypothetical protein